MNRKTLNKAQVNHLRRLLGWVRCEVGQSPDELIATVRHIASKVDIDDYGKGRMVEEYRKASNVPKYIRAALKSLAPVVREAEGEIIDAGTSVVRTQAATKRGNGPRSGIRSIPTAAPTRRVQIPLPAPHTKDE